jgi:signal transduction histidine kinase
MTATPDDAAPDPQQIIAELQRKLDESRAELAARNSAYSERIAYQSAANEVLKVMSASPGDPQPVFDLIVERARDLCGGYGATVYQFDGTLIHWRAATGVSDDRSARQVIEAMYPMVPTREWPSGRAIIDRQIIHIRDLETEPGLTPAMRGLTAKSIVLVPLMRGGLPIGAVALGSRKLGGFTDTQIELLKTFADQAVIAIENARLFNEVQAKTRDLEESLQQQTATAGVLEVISRSTFDLQTVFNTVAESAVRLCGADRAFIFRFDGELLRMVVAYNASPEFAEFVRQHPIRPGRQSGSARAALERRTVQIVDVRDDGDYTYGAKEVEAIRTLLGVPILKGDELFGVMMIYRLEVRAFTERQIALVETFANQAAIAIENVRLFEAEQRQTLELAKSLDDLRSAQDRLVQTEKLASLGQLTAGIAHEIKNPLNFVNNFSALSAELVSELNETLMPAPLDQKMRGDIDELTAMLKSNLEKVVQHGRRADSIVKNMLQHSREGLSERRSADINTLVGESLNLAYHGARAEKPGFAIMLKQDLDPDAGALELYPQEITRALLNLISNGFYAAVGRKAETDDVAFEPILSATTRNLGKTVEIRIRDNGSGIPPDVREKMFNPFFTTKPTGEGTGLGLSMTHDIIVKQHGGRIDVETELGAFTEFIITLPRGNGTAARSEPE